MTCVIIDLEKITIALDVERHAPRENHYYDHKGLPCPVVDSHESSSRHASVKSGPKVLEYAVRLAKHTESAVGDA